MANKGQSSAVVSQAQQSLSALITLARRVSPDKPIKPYWDSIKVGSGRVSFYTLAQAYGIKPEDVKAHLGPRGFFVAHLGQLAKVSVSAEQIRATLGSL